MLLSPVTVAPHLPQWIPVQKESFDLFLHTKDHAARCAWVCPDEAFQKASSLSWSQAWAVLLSADRVNKITQWTSEILTIVVANNCVSEPVLHPLCCRAFAVCLAGRDLRGRTWAATCPPPPYFTGNSYELNLAPNKHLTEADKLPTNELRTPDTELGSPLNRWSGTGLTFSAPNDFLLHRWVTWITQVFSGRPRGETESKHRRNNVTPCSPEI